MFFEKETLSFNISEVLEIKQNNVSMFNSGRNYNALSFRFSADAILKTDVHEYRVKDNFVTYVPSRLDYSRTAKVDDLIVIHFDTVNCHTENIESFESKNSDILANLFRNILDCWNKKELGYRYKCSAILCEILAECYAENYVPNVKKSKIRSSVEYILKNYKKSDLTIKEIARQSFMSEVYFRKLFKEEQGLSPKKYIVKLRMQHAVGLISTGYYSLNEVAYMSGYNDYKYFSTEFKNAIGVSPSEYLHNYK